MSLLLASIGPAISIGALVYMIRLYRVLTKRENRIIETQRDVAKLLAESRKLGDDTDWMLQFIASN